MKIIKCLIFSSLITAPYLSQAAANGNECDFFTHPNFYCSSYDKANMVSPVVTGKNLQGQFMHVFGPKNSRYANIIGSCNENKIHFAWDEQGFSGTFSGTLRYDKYDKYYEIINISAIINQENVSIRRMNCERK